jgi:ethylmalonyl-CoA/methylmalonyl-CoA decarboxylase
MGDWQPHQYPRGRGQILLRETTDVTELVINNPGARHAMSVGMMADLVDAVRVLQEKPPLALLVRGGDDSAFCAGGDLRDVRSHLMNSQAAKGMPVVMGETLDALAALPSVVVAAVEGPALGGGAELLTVADWVVASESAQIGFVHLGLGVTPGWGGAQRLIERVGVPTATELLFEAKRISAEQAREKGLVHLVTPSGEAVSESREWIRRLSRFSQPAVRGLLEILRSARVSSDVRGCEQRVFARLWASADHRAAIDGVKAGG